MSSKSICAHYTKREREWGTGDCPSKSTVRYSCRQLFEITRCDEAAQSQAAAR
jgi:hypothetical protein